VRAASVCIGPASGIVDVEQSTFIERNIDCLEKKGTASIIRIGHYGGNMIERVCQT